MVVIKAYRKALDLFEIATGIKIRSGGIGKIIDSRKAIIPKAKVAYLLLHSLRIKLYVFLSTSSSDLTERIDYVFWFFLYSAIDARIYS